MFITSTTHYGPIVPYRAYKVIREGRDYYDIRLRGKLWSIPKWVFSENNMKDIEENGSVTISKKEQRRQKLARKKKDKTKYDS